MSGKSCFILQRFLWFTNHYRPFGTPEVTISGVPSSFLVAPPKGIGAISLPLSVSLSARDAKLEELAPRIFLIFAKLTNRFVCVCVQGLSQK